MHTVPRNCIGKSGFIVHIEFIGFTNEIPRYITDTQNHIGFTYKSLITCLYLLTVYTVYSTLDLCPTSLEGTKENSKRVVKSPTV